MKCIDVSIVYLIYKVFFILEIKVVLIVIYQRRHQTYPEHRMNPRSAILPSTPELVGLSPCIPQHCDMAGCWQNNCILADIGRKNSTQFLNQYPFLWNISI